MKIYNEFNIDSQRWELYFVNGEKRFRTTVPTRFDLVNNLNIWTQNLETYLNELINEQKS